MGNIHQVFNSATVKKLIDWALVYTYLFYLRNGHAIKL